MGVDELRLNPGNDFWSRVAALGGKLEGAWKTGGHPEFIELAAATLQELVKIPARDLWQAILATQEFAPQQDPLSFFGEPPITLYGAKGFAIEAYFWLAPHISIHDHDFSGAFAVLQGTSLHVEYDFVAQAGRDDVQIGKMALRKAELLEAGDIRPILRGRTFIHQVAHLSRPSVSLAIRTTRSVEENARVRCYLPPGLSAPAPRELSVSGKKKLALMRLLCASPDPGTLRAGAQTLVKNASASEALWLLVTLFEQTGDRTLAAGIARQEPAVCGNFLEAFDLSCAWSRDVSVRWRDLHAEPHRLAACLSAFVRDPKICREIVRSYTSRRGGTVATWLNEMAALGLADFELNDSSKVILEGLTADVEPDVIARRLMGEFDGLALPEALADIQRCRDELEKFALIRPYLG